MNAKAVTAKPDARRVARDALVRIDRDEAYANLVVPAMLRESGLSGRDRNFVTELVYGTTRMRRACDFLLDRHLTSPPVVEVRNTLRLGAYQLAFAGTKPHAAVNSTVAIAPPRGRSLVNAVLRRVADEVSAGRIEWPDRATELSYPDWIVRRLVSELGEDVAVAAMARMNQPPPVTARADGYVQDLASQWVAECLEARPGERIADLCAAPGGKATALAAAVAPGGVVAAGDLRPARARLVRTNAAQLHDERLGRGVVVYVGDGAQPPLRPRSFDRVLVDAPCSGLGALRRRPDARWRIARDDLAVLAELQRSIIDAAVALVRPGGVVVYSVCTLTAQESIAHDRPELEALAPPGPPWVAYGRGARLLPQTADTDGMVMLRWRIS